VFSGSIVAIVTPMRDGGKVDYDKFAELVEFQIANGTDGVVPMGTTGESATLPHDEHREVIKACVDAVAGRAKVIAGTGSNSTDEAISLTRFAEKAGCDGSLQVSPYYNKPSQEGLYQHFRSIAEAVGIPLVLYNVPGRTGREIAVDTVARLSELRNVAALKEAGGSVDRVSDIIRSCDITVLSGDDSLTLPMMVLGAAGVISVAANVVPADVKAMVASALSGDWDKAREQHFKMLPLVRELFRECNPAGIKTAMRLAGMINGEMRLPLVPYTRENEARMEKVLKDYGIIED
jgi:4-hydroxy-tetrahydrodipicolinate synthase